MLKYSRYWDGHSFIYVGFFSIEVASLYYVMVYFDGWVFWGHLFSHGVFYWFEFDD